MTGDMSYINDAANQVIKYHKYLWCPEKRSLFFSYLSLKNAENSPEKSGESVVKINPVRMA